MNHLIALRELRDLGELFLHERLQVFLLARPLGLRLRRLLLQGLDLFQMTLLEILLLHKKLNKALKGGEEKETEVNGCVLSGLGEFLFEGLDFAFKRSVITLKGN